MTFVESLYLALVSIVSANFLVGYFTNGQKKIQDVLLCAKPLKIELAGFLGSNQFIENIDHNRYGLGKSRFVGKVRLVRESGPTYVRARCSVVKIKSTNGYILYFRCEEFPGAIIYELS